MVEFSIKSSLAASAQEVFDWVGDFKDLAHLLPSVTDVQIVKENGKTFRTFHLNGKPAKEELLTSTPEGYTYGVVAPGPPIQSSTVKIASDKNGATLEWSARLEPGAPSDAAIMIFGVFHDGITNVGHRFNN